MKIHRLITASFLAAALSTLSIGAAFAQTAPVAQDDAYSVDEGETLVVDAASGVLSNDTATEDATLTAVLVTDVTGGTLTLDADGSFTYVPAASTTSDSFTYVANDGTADSEPATVSITVNPANEAPTAVDDAYSVEAGESLTVAAPGVLGNDTDPQGDALTAMLETDVTGGTLTLDADGSFTYQPASGTTDDTFTYKVSDGDLESGEATVSITVGSEEEEEEGEEGGRKGFVGQVQGAPGSSVTLAQQGTGEMVSISLPSGYDLKTPGGPRAGEFVDGAEVVILAQRVGDGWEALSVLVKPVKPVAPPVTGAVVSVENGVLTIVRPNGTTKQMTLPAGADAPEEGEVITALVEDEGESEQTSKATGLVRAAQVRDRLRQGLEELTTQEEDGAGEADDSQIQILADLLEAHQSRHLAILDEVQDKVQNPRAREAIGQARARAEARGQEVLNAVQQARERRGGPKAGDETGTSTRGGGRPEGVGRGQQP